MIVCPNENCVFHKKGLAKLGNWYSSHGSYPLRGNRVTRYRCRYCGKTFSQRCLNGLKSLQREDIKPSEVFLAWCKGSTISELAREYNCSTSLVRARIQRYQGTPEMRGL